MSSSAAASDQDRIVELLGLQPLLLQHVLVEQAQSLLQLSQEERRVLMHRQRREEQTKQVSCAHLVLSDQLLAL